MSMICRHRYGRRVSPMTACSSLSSPFWILPEVKDPKEWWGGHIWEDNRKHAIAISIRFLADVSTHSIWYNTSLAKPEELRSFDDYLSTRNGKDKIGFSDPRVPSSGQSVWSFMWEARRAKSFSRNWSSKSCS